MQYFDTDVLIHYLINQEVAKHQQAQELYRLAARNQTFFISLLSLQELTYALAKLPLKDISAMDIAATVRNWHSPDLVNYNSEIFARALHLAQHIGFKNINDCLHVALAEAQHCTELITYNRKDFTRLQPFTSLKINIL